MPYEDEAEIWYNILEKDSLKEVYNITYNTWNSDSDFYYAFTEVDLFKKINDASSIQEFALQMDVDNNEVIQWLNKLYIFLQQNNCINYLYQYKMLPNSFQTKMESFKNLMNYMEMKYQMIYLI